MQNKSKLVLYLFIDFFFFKVIFFVCFNCYFVDVYFDKNYEVKFDIFRYKFFIFFYRLNLVNVCMYMKDWFKLVNFVQLFGLEV